MNKKNSSFDSLHKEAMRIEEDSTYSSKSHFNAADIFKQQSQSPETKTAHKVPFDYSDLLPLLA